MNRGWGCYLSNEMSKGQHDKYIYNDEKEGTSGASILCLITQEEGGHSM